QIVVERLAVVANQAGIIGALDLCDSVFDGISGAETQTIVGFSERYPVITAVAIFNIFNSGTGQMGADFLRNLTECEIQPVIPYVEYLATHRFDRRKQGQKYSLGNVVHVNKGTPLIAVENGNYTFLNGLGS